MQQESPGYLYLFNRFIPSVLLVIVVSMSFAFVCGCALPFGHSSESFVGEFWPQADLRLDTDAAPSELLVGKISVGSGTNLVLRLTRMPSQGHSVGRHEFFEQFFFQLPKSPQTEESYSLSETEGSFAYYAFGGYWPFASDPENSGKARLVVLEANAIALVARISTELHAEAQGHEGQKQVSPIVVHLNGVFRFARGPGAPPNIAYFPKKK